MPVNGSTLIPWIVDIATGNDSNGGTSEAVLASVTDGATTSGTVHLTSASNPFTSGMVGHGVQVGANWRTIITFTNSGSVDYSGASLGNLSSQTVTVGGPLRTINKVANLSGAPLAPGDVIAVAPSPLAYREAVTLGQSGAAVGSGITGVSTAVPAVVTTSGSHGLVVGQWVYLSGLVGNSELNGPHQVTVVGSGTTFSIDNTAAGSTYTSGGVVEQLIALVGDVDGYWTGKSGNVTLSAWTGSDFVTPANAPLILSGKSGWTVQNLTIQGGAQRCVDGTTAGSQYLAFIGGLWQTPATASQAAISLQGTVDTAMHAVIDRIVMHYFGVGGSVAAITSPTSTGADYDLDVLLRNCELLDYGSGPDIDIITSGANSFKPGGVRVRNCTIFGEAQAIRSNDANWSVTIPAEVMNSAVEGFTGSQAFRSITTAGVIVEDYNVVGANSARTNVNAGTADAMVATPLIEAGQAIYTGRGTREYGSVGRSSPFLSLGNTEVAIGSPSTVTDDATVGSISWSNPGNVTYPDGTNASASMTSGNDSHYLKAVGFGFTIPGNATIDGVRLEVLRAGGTSASPSGGSAGAKLIKAGTIGGGNKTDTHTFASGYYIIGGHCDLWGNTLTPSDVNSSTFGVAYAIHGTGTQTQTVDYLRLFIYYHLSDPAVPADILCQPRPAGAYSTLYSGTATSGGAATLTDTGQGWGVNALAFAMLAITGGTGSGQRKLIKSNTATVITAHSNWVTNPDSSSTYAVYLASAGICETGQATSGTATTLVCSNASWQTNQWLGWTLEITSGTGSGQRVPITANTSTSLTPGPNQATTQWTTNPDSTSVFAIYRGVGGVTAIQSAAGAYERHDTAAREATIIDTGATYAARIDGPGDIDLLVAVDATSTTITINYRSTANAAPTAQVLANAEIGVVASTVQTGSTGQGTYTTLTIPAFTPTAPGVVRLRLTSGATTPTDAAYFDTAAIS